MTHFKSKSLIQVSQAGIVHFPALVIEGDFFSTKTHPDIVMLSEEGLTKKKNLTLSSNCACIQPNSVPMYTNTVFCTVYSC